MRRLPQLAAASAVALALLAGCGGGGGKPAASDTAGFAPGDVAAFFTVDTDLQSSQWQKAEALLDKFPGKEDLLDQIRSSLSKQGVDWDRDVKPALGKEVGVAWLDFQNAAQDVVGFTKPKDTAKFDALLEKGSSPMAHEELEGWTIFARDQRKLDRFKQMRSSAGSLADDDAYKSATGDLPEDALASAFVRGSDVERALERSIAASGAPSGTLQTYLGRLDSVGAAVTAESDGIRVAAGLNGDLKGNPPSYHPALPSSFAAGPVFYLSFNHLQGPLHKLLENAGRLSPGFDQQRAQIETALGMSLEDDVLPLFGGEGALALYPTSSGAPEVVFAAKVADESKAQRLLDRILALAQLSGRYRASSIEIGGERALEIDTSRTSLFAAAFGGKLVISNLRSGIEDVQGTGATLAGDPAYKAAVSGAKLPDEPTGFVYSNLHAGLDYLFSYLEGRGQTIPQSVRENVAPLRGLLLYWTKDGGNFSFAGFLGIE